MGKFNNGLRLQAACGVSTLTACSYFEPDEQNPGDCRFHGPAGQCTQGLAAIARMSAHLNTLPEPITTESKAYSLLKQEEQHAKKVKELREELDQAIQSLEELKNAAAWAEETYDLNEYLWENEDDVVPFMTLIEIRRTTHAAMRNVFSQAKEALA